MYVRPPRSNIWIPRERRFFFLSAAQLLSELRSHLLTNESTCVCARADYRCMQQLLLYHPGRCREVKRAATTYRRNIGPIERARHVLSRPTCTAPRYVIIPAGCLSPRYLWDREREIEIETCPIVPVPSAVPICLPKRAAYLRNRRCNSSGDLTRKN